MAFQTKYSVTFRDVENTEWLIYYQYDPWAGAITELTPGKDPLKIRYPGQDKLQPIVGSAAEIQMVYESAIENLFVEEDQTVRVYITNGSFLWIGFLTPYMHFKKMGEHPHYVTVLATDQLGQLKEQPFRDDSGDPQYYIDDELTWLYAVLGKTGLSLGVYEDLNIYDASWDDDPEDSPLDKTYWHPERYWDPVEDMSESCYQVLQDIVDKYGARVFQSDTSWYLQRAGSMWSKHTTRNWSSAAVYVDYDTDYIKYNRVDEGGIWMYRPEISRLKRAGRVEVTVDPGRKDCLIENSTFDNFTRKSGGTGEYYYWTTDGAPTEADGYVNVGVVLAGAASVLRYTSYFNGVTSLQLTCEFMAEWGGSTTGATIAIRITTGIYYYTTSGWTAVAGNWEYDVYTALSGSSMTDYGKITIDIPNITNGYNWNYENFDVYLYQMDVDDSTTDCALYYRNVRLEPAYETGFPATVTHTEESDVTSFHTIRKTINHGSHMSVKGDTDSYYFMQESTTLRDDVEDYHLIGHNYIVSTGNYLATIQDILAKHLLESNYYSLDQIRGEMRGDFRYHYALVEDTLTDPIGFPKTFVGADLTYDTRMCTWDGTWHEVRPKYNSSGLEWDSHDFAGAGTITANELEIDTFDITVAEEQGYFESYTAVIGEMIRMVITLTDDGSSDLPTVTMDGDAVSVAWGANYIEYYCDSAGAKELQLGGSVPRYLNLTATVDMYYLTGI